MGKRSRNNQTETEEAEETSEELPREPSEAEPEEPEHDIESEVESEEPGHETDDDNEEGRRVRVMRFAKRLMDRRELSSDTREILGSVLATSDKAKNEAVRMVAREVRSYLDALELKEDLKELLTGYSLEISLSLKPLEAALQRAEDEPADEG